MKKIASILLFFLSLLYSIAPFASSLCSLTRVNIKNNSSLDCVLTDFIGLKKIQPEAVLFKNQSIAFDLAETSSGKNLILRYQCGDEASILLYFYSNFESTGTSYVFHDRLIIKHKNLNIKSLINKGQCNIFAQSKPSERFIEIDDPLD